MARSYFVNGETLVTINGSELGLASDPVTVTLDSKYLDIKVNSFGDVPPEVQFMLTEAQIHMTLVNFDRTVLDTALALSQGGTSTVGQMVSAGTLMGANSNFFSLRLQSPVAVKPWTFGHAYMVDAFDFPLGVERSLVTCTFRALPYVADPKTAAGAVLWTYT
jgi:hypothetical protein